MPTLTKTASKRARKAAAHLAAWAGGDTLLLAHPCASAHIATGAAAHFNTAVAAAQLHNAKRAPAVGVYDEMEAAFAAQAAPPRPSVFVTSVWDEHVAAFDSMAAQLRASARQVSMWDDVEGSFEAAAAQLRADACLTSIWDVLPMAPERVCRIFARALTTVAASALV